MLTRPTLAHYTRTAQEMQETADDLFAVIKSGAVKVAINQRVPLKDAAKAQEALAGEEDNRGDGFNSLTHFRLPWRELDAIQAIGNRRSCLDGRLGGRPGVQQSGAVMRWPEGVK